MLRIRGLGCQAPTDDPLAEVMNRARAVIGLWEVKDLGSATVATLIALGNRGVTRALSQMWNLIADPKEPADVRETAYAAVRTLRWLAESRDLIG